MVVLKLHYLVWLHAFMILSFVFNVWRFFTIENHRSDSGHIMVLHVLFAIGSIADALSMTEIYP